MTDAVLSTTPDEPTPAETPVEPAPLAGHAPVKPDSPLFSDFPIKPEIIQALADVGIEHTFAIQELTLPIALAGSDLIGQARTGTGKTLGFGVPLLNRLELPGAHLNLASDYQVKVALRVCDIGADTSIGKKHQGGVSRVSGFWT